MPELPPPSSEPALPGPETEPPEPEDSGRSGLIVFALMVLLVIGGWFLVKKLLEMTAIQNCVMSGRKNCMPIDPNAVGN